MNIGKELTILSWNVNGIRALIKKEALLWVDEIHPDILCLQEIKAEKAEIPKSFNKEYKKAATIEDLEKGRKKEELSDFNKALLKARRYRE